MRFAYIAIFPICIASFATSVQAEDSNKDKPEYSTGRTQTPVPETKGQKQPQEADILSAARLLSGVAKSSEEPHSTTAGLC